MRLRIFQQLRVQSVSPDGGGRREDVAFHGFYDISAVEAPLERQQREVDCVNSKDIAVNSFIVPRRARTVIAIIVSFVVRVAFESIGIVVESLAHAVGTGRPFFAAGRDAFRKRGCIDAGLFRHDINQYPVNKACSRSIGLNRFSFDVGLGKISRDVVVFANDD